MLISFKRPVQVGYLTHEFSFRAGKRVFQNPVIKRHVVSVKVLGTPDVKDQRDLPNGSGLTRQGRASFARTLGGRCLTHVKGRPMDFQAALRVSL